MHCLHRPNWNLCLETVSLYSSHGLNRQNGLCNVHRDLVNNRYGLVDKYYIAQFKPVMTVIMVLPRWIQQLSVRYQLIVQQILMIGNVPIVRVDIY